ncbi:MULTISPECIES: hypothetical protein [Nocardia]|uniref:hypothetical protein n=1 Tax=Nocardia abscessus TaxID=120957 RepID=UPI0018932AC1|nr:hypothetical protein [Nocardia abscessus]MBF6470950.1 hypothetical protein [Nocardia abscessus]
MLPPDLEGEKYQADVENDRIADDGRNGKQWHRVDRQVWSSQADVQVSEPLKATVHNLIHQ